MTDDSSRVEPAHEFGFETRQLHAGQRRSDAGVELPRLAGIERGMEKVAQVIFGCAVALLVTWLMSKVWLIKPKTA